MKLPIEYVDIRLSVHATENPRKVKKAALNLLPEKSIEGVTFKENVVSGHYRNPIILLTTRIKDKSVIEAFVTKLSSHISDLDKETILNESNLLMEKNNLYLRFDKQAAFENELRLHKADAIHVRFRLRKKGNVEIMRELGLTP